VTKNAIGDKVLFSGTLVNGKMEGKGTWKVIQVSFKHKVTLCSDLNKLPPRHFNSIFLQKFPVQLFPPAGLRSEEWRCYPNFFVSPSALLLIVTPM
jgi:hypothetical protein